MKLQRFDGGLHTRLAPQLLGIDQARELINVDIAKGVLTSVKEPGAPTYTTNVFAHWDELSSTWLSAAERRSYVTDSKLTFYTTSASGVKYYSPTVGEQSLSLPQPTTAPTLTVDHAFEFSDYGAHREITNFVSGLPFTESLRYLVRGKKTLGGTDYYTPHIKFTLTAKEAPTRVDTEEVTITRAAVIPRIASAGWGGVYSVPTTTTQTISTTITGYRHVEFTDCHCLGADKVEIFRYYQDAYYKVGELTSVASVVLDSTFDISGSTALDATEPDAVWPQGEYTYGYTYYAPDEDLESQISPLTQPVGGISTMGKYTLSGVAAPADPRFTKIRFYKIGGNFTTFIRIAEVNTATAYTDEFPDKDYPVEIYNPYIAGDGPPDSVTYLFYSKAYAMLFGLDGTKLRWSEPGQPYVWRGSYIEFKEELTGIVQISIGILVFTRLKTFLLTGDRPEVFSRQLFDGSQGCIDPYAVQTINSTAVWVSTDGICASSGGKVEVISRDALDKLSITPVDSAVLDDVYYVLADDGYLYCADFRYGSLKFYKHFFNIASLAVKDDTLLGWSQGKLRTLFAGAEDAEFEYLSPKFVEGRATEEKTYKTVYIYYRGVLQLEIIIDDVVVQTLDLPESDTLVNDEIKVGTHEKRGNSIQFRVTGAGSLEELEYVAARQGDQT